MGPLHGLLFSGVEKKMHANVCAVKMTAVRANCHSLAPTLCKCAIVLLTLLCHHKQLLCQAHISKFIMKWTKKLAYSDFWHYRKGLCPVATRVSKEAGSLLYLKLRVDTFSPVDDSWWKKEGVNVKVWLQLPWMNLIHSLFWPSVRNAGRTWRW